MHTRDTALSWQTGVSKKKCKKTERKGRKKKKRRESKESDLLTAAVLP